jgi:DHA1 family tetracycline resistance protein-like MFS transporter
MPNKQTPQSLLLPILLVYFISMLGFSLVLPFLVVIVLKLGGDAKIYGFLGATYSFFELIGSPILGNLSDTYGRRKILLISQGGTLIGWIIFLIGLLLPNHKMHLPLSIALSIPLALIFIARAVDGITGGNISVANAYLADISTKDDRKQNFGKMSAAANFGVIFGPLLAGLLGTTAWGNLLPVIATIFISAIVVLVIYFKLHDVTPKGNSIPKLKLSGELLGIFKIRYVPFFMIMYFFIFLAFNFFYVAFPVYVAGKLHWSVLKLGVFFAVLSGLMILAQGPLLSWLSNKVAGAWLVIAGCLILALAFFLFRFTTLVPIYAGAACFALGNGVMWPTFVSLISNLGNEHNQGAIQGFAGSAGSLASIIGLISGAFIYGAFGSNVFLMATGLMVAIAITCFKLIPIEKEIS